MKLHLGSGSAYFDGWLNVDLDSPTADLHLDLRQKLPFEDAKVNFIFNEHFIEHIPRADALNFLKECHRVLNDGGVLRISTPNLKHIAAAYLNQQIDSWGELWQPDNPCLMLNEAMRSWGHQFLYDADEIRRILLEAGFCEIKFVPWRISEFVELNNLETRPYHHELIVEVIKHVDIQKTEQLNTVDVYESMSRNVAFLQMQLAKKIADYEQLASDWQARGEHIINLELLVKEQRRHIEQMSIAHADDNQTIEEKKLTIDNLVVELNESKSIVNMQNQSIVCLQKEINEFKTSFCARMMSVFRKR